MAAWFEDLDVTATILLRFPPGVAQEEDWLRAMATHPASIIWGVEHEGRLVGTTGVHGIDWQHGHGTTGLVLGDKSVWGRGIAREVMRMRTRFLFTETTLQALRSGYLDGNVPSARAQAGAGDREVGRWHRAYLRSGRWVDHVLPEVLRQDWEAANPPA